MSELEVAAAEGLSEKDIKKLEKKRQKEAKAAAKAAAQAARQAEQSAANQVPIVFHPDDASFGDFEMIQSRYKTERNFVEVGELSAAMTDQKVWIRARVHSVRARGKIFFVVLRRGFSTVQLTGATGEIVTKEMMKYVSKLPAETVVDVEAVVTKPADPIQSCSVSDVELQIVKIFAVSRPSLDLPFSLEEAGRRLPEGEEDFFDEDEEEAKAKEVAESAAADPAAKHFIKVGQKTRLDNRVLDLRTPANHAIFRLQSRVCHHFREYLWDLGFTEIHSPKIIAGTSEGGAAVFRLKYFGREACLAQSPQLYKQMGVMADFFRVFEIAPVFRAENANTHRHMTEFMGLDFEMEIKEHYHEVLSVLGNLFVHIFDALKDNCAKEIGAVNEQFPFEALKYRPKDQTLVLTFAEAAKMLEEAGEPVDNDFTTPQEKLLGKLVRAKYDTDFYIVDKYPSTARPFYTMPDHDDPNVTNSYDVFIRGEEITSGAQRIHDAEMLAKRAQECGIEVDTIQSYIESFRFGAYPHGGAGIGLERVVMLYLGLSNIRKSSMFPRDPKRYTP